MKRKQLLMKMLLAVAMLGVGATSAWAYDWTQKASYTFEDGSTTPFTIANGTGRFATAFADDATEGSKVLQFNNTNKLYGNNYGYAKYNFSSLTSDASAVKVEFDFLAQGLYSCFSLRDADATPSHSKNGYSNIGAFINVGSMRISGSNVFGVNGAKVDAGSLGTWYHAEIIVDLSASTVDYTIKSLDLSSTIVEVTDASYYGSSTSKCTQLDFFTTSGDNSTALCGAIDNIVVSSYVSASDHNYTINAVAGGTTLATLATGKCSEGSNYSYAALPYVVSYGGSYYYLNDNTVSGYSTTTYTMGDADETKEITYTLDESIVFFLEGETLGQSTSSSSCSSGAYSNYYTGPYSISITDAGTYNLETYVASRNTNSSLEVYTNFSTTSVAKIAKNCSLGANSCSFVAGAGSTMRVGGPYYDSKFQNSLGFDYILIRKTGAASALTKTISAAGWATYCSPYALDLENATGLTEAYIITGGAGGVLTKTSVKGGTVPANTGLLLKGTEGSAVNVTIPVVGTSSTDVDGNKLVGVTAETTLDLDSDDDGTADVSVYVLMTSPSLAFYQTTTTAFTLGANTAYLPSNFDNGGVRQFYNLFSDDATGIEDAVNSEEIKVKSYYNLNGQRVNQPTRGLYIVNGKKVIIK